AWVLPPQSRLTPLTQAERDQVMQASVLYGHYERSVDRESAYEKLREKMESREPAEAEQAARKRQPPSQMDQMGKIVGDMAKSAARSMGTQIGRQLMRGILGSLFFFADVIPRAEIPARQPDKKFRSRIYQRSSSTFMERKSIKSLSDITPTK
ncbi:MAG: DUF853 family protein, partial [Syntrophobacterales bacterium]